MEKESRKRVRKRNIQKAVLGTVAAAGGLSVALMAPNALQMLGMFDDADLKRRRRYRHSCNRAFDTLLRQGSIVLEKTRHGTFARLTPRGKYMLWRWGEEMPRHKKPRWDGKWRVIVFDIREKNKSVREKLRAMLTRIGFIRLQNSVWVFPYDCEEMHILLKAELKAGKSILYMIVDTIENDQSLRTHFGLPKK